jgi:DNA-directed RNA polymerase subunit omega
MLTALVVRQIRKSVSTMKTELIEKAQKIITHPPLLINLVSRRLRQLNQGRSPKINPHSYPGKLGQADIALLEIIEGHITAESIPENE